MSARFDGGAARCAALASGSSWKPTWMTETAASSTARACRSSSAGCDLRSANIHKAADAFLTRAGLTAAPRTRSSDGSPHSASCNAGRKPRPC